MELDDRPRGPVKCVLSQPIVSVHGLCFEASVARVGLDLSAPSRFTPVHYAESKCDAIANMPNRA